MGGGAAVIGLLAAHAGYPAAFLLIAALVLPALVPALREQPTQPTGVTNAYPFPHGHQCRRIHRNTRRHPAFGAIPSFQPGVSHGYPEFIENCDAIVMGRTTFLPALGAPTWPWAGLQVYILTSHPLPPKHPPTS
jgi:hypothetical protein